MTSQSPEIKILHNMLVNVHQNLMHLTIAYVSALRHVLLKAIANYKLLYAEIKKENDRLLLLEPVSFLGTGCMYLNTMYYRCNVLGSACVRSLAII